jgi:hypothetical protein
MEKICQMYCISEIRKKDSNQRLVITLSNHNEKDDLLQSFHQSRYN